MNNTQIKFLQGNEACVEAAIKVGCRFFAGYPITPSTEIAEGMARKLPEVSGTFIQMEDEIASMGAIIGASLCGLKTLTATSGPGFSLKQENIGYAIIAEVPCVIVNVQRGGPSTGLPTLPAQGDVMQARWGTHGDHPAIVLTPSSVKEYFDLTVKAFNLAEKFRTPVILLPDEVIAHMREKAEIPNEIKIVNRKKPGILSGKENYKPYKVKNDNDVPIIPNFGEGYRFNVTGLIHDETGFPTASPEITDFLIRRLHKKIESGYDEIKGIEIDIPPNCDRAILSYGSSFRSAKQAAIQQGIGSIKLTTLFPFPRKEIFELTKKIKTIFVVEMNLGQILHEVNESVCGQARLPVCRQARPDGQAKAIGINNVSGQLMTPEFIKRKIEECR